MRKAEYGFKMNRTICRTDRTHSSTNRAKFSTDRAKYSANMVKPSNTGGKSLWSSNRAQIKRH
jgi:hypothetical protein